MSKIAIIIMGLSLVSVSPHAYSNNRCGILFDSSIPTVQNNSRNHRSSAFDAVESAIDVIRQNRIRTTENLALFEINYKYSVNRTTKQVNISEINVVFFDKTVKNKYRTTNHTYSITFDVENQSSPSFTRSAFEANYVEIGFPIKGSLVRDISLEKLKNIISSEKAIEAAMATTSNPIQNLHKKLKLVYIESEQSFAYQIYSAKGTGSLLKVDVLTGKVSPYQFNRTPRAHDLRLTNGDRPSGF